MPEESYRPHLQIATFCEMAMQEANGTLSLIRITDRRFVSGVTPEMQPVAIQLTLVVVLKSGFMQGKGTVRITGNTPSEKPLPSVHAPVLFEGYERGVGIIMPMSLLLDEEGLYWFDIFVNEERFTRVPLRILYQQQQQTNLQFGTGGPTSS